MSVPLWRRLWPFGGGDAAAPITDADWHDATAALPLVAALDENDRARLRELAEAFLDAKRIRPAGGQTLGPRERIVIAAQACLPVLVLGLDAYAGWRTIIVHPDEFVAPQHELDEAGVEHEWEETRSGESWLGGPVVLSWADVEASGRGDGYNVVIHEMAHKLDMLNGDTNGFPPLHRDMDAERWSRVFGAAFADLERRLDRGQTTAIDDYAAESPGEFFAVLSEYFFERPKLVRKAYRAVYRELVDFYRQDPLGRPRCRPLPVPA